MDRVFLMLFFFTCGIIHSCITSLEPVNNEQVRKQMARLNDSLRNISFKIELNNEYLREKISNMNNTLRNISSSNVQDWDDDTLQNLRTKLDYLAIQASGVDKSCKTPAEFEEAEQLRDIIRKMQLKLGIIPYITAMFQFQTMKWDCKGSNSPNFALKPDEIPGFPNTETVEAAQHFARMWDRIFQHSNDSNIKLFKERLLKLYPDVSLTEFAKKLGIWFGSLSGCKCGKISIGYFSALLKNTNELIEALKFWKSYDIPMFLEIVRIFDEVRQDF